MRKSKSITFSRIIIAFVAGLFVFTISFRVSFNGYSNSIIRYVQYETLEDIKKIEEAITTYQRENKQLPQSLSDIQAAVRIDESETPLDGWNNPFIYSTDGTNYTIISYGRDSRPGGKGLDSDITNRTKDLKNIGPTIKQFVTESLNLFIVCIISGIVTFFIAYKGFDNKMARNVGLLGSIVRFIIIVGAASVMAIFIAIFHIPSGH